MWIQFEHSSGKSKIDTTVFHDLSIAIQKDNNVNCYYLDNPVFSYFKSNEFSGSLADGGSVNCEKIALYPHASGTHTECALHVAAVDFDMRHIQIPAFMLCKLITIEPMQIDDDKVLHISQFESLKNDNKSDAIIVRTKPNSTVKKHQNYSGSNPAYFDPEVLVFLKELGFKHLLTDLPSIDKESDEGRLSAHKNWFLTNGIAPKDRTITELIFVDDAIQDGIYALNIQIPTIETDAVPSRILLYPCV